jgi:predicted PurR-regulated permease PerM
MAVMTTLLVLVVLWQFRSVVVFVLISLTRAAAIRPLFMHLVGKNRIVKMGWILLYLVIMGSLGYLVLISIEMAFHEIQLLAQSLSTQDTWRVPIWMGARAPLYSLLARLPPPSRILDAAAGDQGQLVLPAVLGFTRGIVGLVSGGFVITFLSIYWSINQIHFERLWLSVLPPGQRTHARGVWRTIEPEIGAYIRGEVVQSILAGLFLGLGYWLLGSPYPALLALAGAVASLVPIVGVGLAVIPVILIGLLTGLQVSLLTAVYALVVFIALSIWVRPRLINRRWDNPMLTVILLIALADAFGLVGIIATPPISVVCQILWNRLVSRRAINGAAANISDLMARQAGLADTIKTSDEVPPALVTSSMERLAQLIARSEPILQPVPASILPDGPPPNVQIGQAPQPEPDRPNGSK